MPRGRKVSPEFADIDGVVPSSRQVSPRSTADADGLEVFGLGLSRLPKALAVRDWLLAEAMQLADPGQILPGLAERLHELIHYATNRLGLESLEDSSFATYECAVNGLEAMTWLDENRPDVAAAIRGRHGNAGH